MERGVRSSEEFRKSLEPDYSGFEGPKTAASPTMQHAAHGPAHEVKTPAVPGPARPAHHPRRKRFEMIATVFLLLILVGVTVLAAMTDSSIFIVLVSLLPSIFTIVISLIIYEAVTDNKQVLWVIPLALIALFHWIAKTQGGIFGRIDVEVLTAVNILVAFLYLSINYLLMQDPSAKDPRPTKAKVIVKEVIKEVPVEKVVVKEVVKEVHTPVIIEKEPEDLARFIASIEDKSKALNFVIGRVYNAYHGGTKELRERINVKQEWYDQFSQIPKDSSEVDFVALSDLITRFEERLKLLEKSEKEAFGSHHEGFKNLVRDAEGKDAVIDVLDKNDKDPVRTYYEGALQFCGKVRDYIKKRESPAAEENAYVPREDEEEKQPAPRSSWFGKKK